MKKIIKKIATVFASLSLLCLFACASTPVPKDENQNESEVIKEITQEEVIEIIEEVVISPEEEFLNSIENLTLQFVEIPKESTVKKDFSSAYKIAVTDNGTALADYQFVIKYPSAKNGTEIAFAEDVVSTDSEGIYLFTPKTPEFAANTTIQASLYTELTDEEVIATVNEKTVSASYKVKSNTIQKGCLLFVWEYNEKDRATNNFNDLQSSLRKKNISLCGNAPINDKSDIGKSLKTLYTENYEIVEDMYGYLIVGTVKFTQPVAPTEDESGYLCSLVAEISAINMKNGSKVFEQTFTQETIGSNWTKATTACKTALADQIVEALVYGL